MFYFKIYINLFETDQKNKSKISLINVYKTLANTFLENKLINRIQNRHNILNHEQYEINLNSHFFDKAIFYILTTIDIL